MSEHFITKPNPTIEGLSSKIDMLLVDGTEASFRVDTDTTAVVRRGHTPGGGYVRKIARRDNRTFLTPKGVAYTLGIGTLYDSHIQHDRYGFSYQIHVLPGDQVGASLYSMPCNIDNGPPFSPENDVFKKSWFEAGESPTGLDLVTADFEELAERFSGVTKEDQVDEWNRTRIEAVAYDKSVGKLLYQTERLLNIKPIKFEEFMPSGGAINLSRRTNSQKESEIWIELENSPKQSLSGPAHADGTVFIVNDTQRLVRSKSFNRLYQVTGEIEDVYPAPPRPEFAGLTPKNDVDSLALRLAVLGLR
jgi:hypothetical protein